MLERRERPAAEPRSASTLATTSQRPGVLDTPREGAQRRAAGEPVTPHPGAAAGARRTPSVRGSRRRAAIAGEPSVEPSSTSRSWSGQARLGRQRGEQIAEMALLVDERHDDRDMKPPAHAGASSLRWAGQSERGQQADHGRDLQVVEARERERHHRQRRQRRLTAHASGSSRASGRSAGRGRGWRARAARRAMRRRGCPSSTRATGSRSRPTGAARSGGSYQAGR